MRHFAHGKRRATASVTVEFGQNDSSDLERIVEMSHDADRLLTSRRICHKQNFLRLQEIAQSLQFLDQRLINFLATRGIENVDVVARIGLRPNRCRGCAQDILLVGWRRENRDVDLPAKRGELFDRRRTLQIHCDQTRSMTLLF